MRQPERLGVVIDPTTQPIRSTERSGVLYPERLTRYSAGWIAPDPAVSTVVDQYWHVSWSLNEGERIDQRIVDLPAVTLTVEVGDVAAPIMITGVHSKAWRRIIHGVGEVFAIRLRPAGLAVISDLSPNEIADSVVPLTSSLDARAHAVMAGVSTATGVTDKARMADSLIRELLNERTPTRSGLLANESLDELRSRVRPRVGLALASNLGRSERTIQRALTGTLGHGPKWVSRRIRLQEVALALAMQRTDDLAAIAAELGYSDQSHLAADFRSVTGIVPSAYRGDVLRLTGDGDSG